MSLTITPLSPALGAQISGIDLTREISREHRDAVEQALLQHQVLQEQVLLHHQCERLQ